MPKQPLPCFFCRERPLITRLVDYRHGTTGKRGSYRRRICQTCENKPKHVKEIRGDWKGK